MYYYMLWMMRRHFKVAEYQAPITAKSWAHVKLVVGMSQFLHIIIHCKPWLARFCKPTYTGWWFQTCFIFHNMG